MRGLPNFDGRPVLLVIVRRGRTDMYRFLQQTFAEQPVYITWDRREGEPRHGKRVPGDRRREARRHSDSLIRLETLPFIAVAPAGRGVTQKARASDIC